MGLLVRRGSVFKRLVRLGHRHIFALLLTLALVLLVGSTVIVGYGNYIALGRLAK